MTASARDIIFNHSERVAPLGLIAIPGSEELGKKVNDYLVTWSRAGLTDDQIAAANKTVSVYQSVAGEPTENDFGFVVDVYKRQFLTHTHTPSGC